jgi:hypothetical protein
MHDHAAQSRLTVMVYHDGDACGRASLVNSLASARQKATTWRSTLLSLPGYVDVSDLDARSDT